MQDSLPYLRLGEFLTNSADPMTSLSHANPRNFTL